MAKSDVDKEKVKIFVVVPESVEVFLVDGGLNFLPAIQLVFALPMKSMAWLERFQTVLKLLPKSPFLSLWTIIHKLMVDVWTPETQPITFSPSLKPFQSQRVMLLLTMKRLNRLWFVNTIEHKEKLVWIQFLVKLLLTG